MSKKKKSKGALNILSPKSQNMMGYGFLMPWLIGFILFTAIPFIITIYLSFADVKRTVRGWEIDFIGFGNYFTAFFLNTEFTPALIGYLTMILTYTPMIIIISFILSLFLNREMKGKSAFRTIYFLPVIVMSGPVMYQIMDSGSANANLMIKEIFIFRIVTYYSPAMADVIVTLFTNFSIILWFTGIPIVLFINGLQKINPSLYEAASIDSATSWQMLWKITVPNIKSIGFVITVFTVAQLGVFATNPAFELIKKAADNIREGLGLATAYSWIYSLITLIIIGIAYFIFKENNDVYGKRRK